VCSPCLDIVNDYHDESDSDDFSSAAVFRWPPVDSSKAVPTTPGESSSTGFKMPKNLRPGQTPLMAIPATRTTAGSNPNRRSQILEINADISSPPRPTSSRSIKAIPRPVTAGSTKGLFGTSILHTPHHKHSRSHHRLSGVPFADERAPFHRNVADEKRQRKVLPAFHADNILDPDLAPYMSDEDMSDGEQMSIFATIAPKVAEIPTTSNATDNIGVGAPTANTREKAPGNNNSQRVRRVDSKSRGSLSGLGAILGGGEGLGAVGDRQQKRTGRRRGSSFIGPLQQRPVTRGKSRGLIRSLAESVGGQSNLPVAGTPVAPSPRASRSASMRGPLAPIVELNTASLEHVKKLLRQLLTDTEIPNVEHWETALIPILLKCTDDLNPDLRAGDDIDIRHYVKVKRVPGAKPGDTSYISGVVFTKNLALKSMPRNLSQPRIVVVTFPIEYSRHQQQLMSLEPVIAQEREFLQNMINRIVALRPTLLLVENNVSGLALTLLAQANVATAYLVKPSVIEAVARCAQADIFSSIDKLALSNFRLGRCASLDVKTFVHGDIPGRKKTFMYLSGCQKELGCTIVLRGADMNTLARIKQITELMVYVVYNLKLETCLMRDEFVVIPSSPTGPVAPVIALNREEPHSQAVSSEPEATSIDADGSGNISGVNITTKQNGNTEADDEAKHSVERGGERNDGVPSTEKQEVTSPTMPTVPPNVPLSDDRLPDDIPNPTYYEDMVRKHETKLLSASPFVSYMQPYLLTRARELERKLVYLRRLKDNLVIQEDDEDEDSDKEAVDPAKSNILDPVKAALAKKPKPQENFLLVDPEAVHGEGEIKHGTTKKANEVLRAIYDAEYDKALHVYETQKKQWENYLAQYDDLFDPFAHQSIAILYSMVCTVTTVPCEGPEIRRLEFYYQDNDWPLGKSDCTLGQYVEFLCDTASHICESTSCDRTMLQHHRSYVHGQARVSVLVSNQIACPIQGMQNTILMWSYCKKCVNTNTPAIPMSESSWKYSFGKYLELAFWSSEMKMRAGSCPHDINRDHVRCFGYHGLTVLFQHDPIDLLEIVVPRTRITYKPEIDLRVKNEQYTQNEGRIKSFFASVQARLKGINIESVSPEKIEACKAEIEVLITRAHEDEDWLVAKLQEKYNKSKYYEIIPLNRALRALQEKVVEWDTKFSAFDNNYFPSEKDIRRLATLQLKKIFLDNTPTPSLQSDNEPVPIREKEEGSKPPSIDGANTPVVSILNSPVGFSSEQAHDVLASVIEEEQEKDKDKTTLQSPAQSDNSSIHNPAGDITSSQELSTPDDDTTPKQQIPLKQVLPDSEPFQSIQETSNQQPSTSAVSISKEQSRSTPALVETDRLSESDASASGASGPRRRASLTEKSRLPQVSAIPRLDISRRRPPPAFSRTVSVPEVPRRRELAGPASAGLGHRSPTMPLKKSSAVGKTTEKIRSEKKLDKFRLSSLSKKPKEKEPQSQIPRSVPNIQLGLKRPIRESTKVSSLAKHFEQLSKEFERERARERRQLAAKRARALPVATSRPIVEVYRNVREAVEEGSDEEQPMNQIPVPPNHETSNMTTSSGSTFKTISPILSRDNSISPPEFNGSQPASTPDTLPDHTHDMAPLSHSHSDADASDGDMSMTSDQEILVVASIGDVLPPATDTDAESAQLDLKLGLPQQHRWMKILSNFWAERSASGWTSLDYPLHPTDHVFNDSDIIVREDEPSSLIAFTLNCNDYVEKLQDIRNSDYSHIGNARPTSSEEQLHNHSFNLQEHPELERSLLKTTGTHLKYQFQEGTAKMFCKIFYAEQFDALRRNCGIADRYVESLSRCIKWDSKGGKTRSVFLKTQDERIVLKSLSPIETAAFIKFAPAYFQFMSEAFFHEVRVSYSKFVSVGLLTLCSCQPLSQRCLDFIRL
jgi:1-phosphatidylinositol-3-phosphate 5-kinase